MVIVTAVAGILTPLTNTGIVIAAKEFFGASLELQGPDMPRPEPLPLLQMLPEGIAVSVLFTLLLAAFSKLTRHAFLVVSLAASAIALVTVLGPVSHATDVPTKVALSLTHIVLAGWPIVLHALFSLRRSR